MQDFGPQFKHSCLEGRVDNTKKYPCIGQNCPIKEQYLLCRKIPHLNIAWFKQTPDSAEGKEKFPNRHSILMITSLIRLIVTFIQRNIFHGPLSKTLQDVLTKIKFFLQLLMVWWFSFNWKTEQNDFILSLFHELVWKLALFLL